MKLLLKIVIALAVLTAIFWIFRNKAPLKVSGIHYAANSTQEFFNEAYKNIDTTKPSDPIAGFTVNHHLLAPFLIAQEFSLVATNKPLTVVLISPNHFYRGDGGAISSNYDWQTPFGLLETDKDIVSKLTEDGVVNVDETPFDEEHGVNNVVGFIKKSLPNAKFVPIIVKDNLTDQAADALAQKLYQILPTDALVVGSLDFSHYLTSNAAEFHDIQTLAAIHNFDYDRIKNLDVDSHPGLRMLLKYFEMKNAQKFVLTKHENSSTVTGNYNLTETTSYINGYFTSGHNDYDNNRTILYFGDLNNQVANTTLLDPMNSAYAFAKSERLFKYNDLTITDFRTSDLQIEKMLKTLGFNLTADPNNISPQIDFVGEDVSVTQPKTWVFKAFRTEPFVLGFVLSPNLTDVYIFPMEVTATSVNMLGKDQASQLMNTLVSESSVQGDVRLQILNGHIIIKQ